MRIFLYIKDFTFFYGHPVQGSIFATTQPWSFDFSVFFHSHEGGYENSYEPNERFLCSFNSVLFFLSRGKFSMDCTYKSLNQMRDLRTKNILKDDKFSCASLDNVKDSKALENPEIMGDYFSKCWFLTHNVVSTFI